MNLELTDKEYLREVIAKTGSIFDEAAPDMLSDMQGEGVEADLRRAAFDGMIDHMINDDMKLIIKAMKIVGITTSQAAQTIDQIMGTTPVFDDINSIEKERQPLEGVPTQSSMFDTSALQTEAPRDPRSYH